MALGDDDDDDDIQHLLMMELAKARLECLSLSKQLTAQRPGYDTMLAEERQIAEHGARELRAQLLQKHKDHSDQTQQRHADDIIQLQQRHKHEILRLQESHKDEIGRLRDDHANSSDRHWIRETMRLMTSHEQIQRLLLQVARMAHKYEDRCPELIAFWKKRFRKRLARLRPHFRKPGR